jgi:putative flippase GtrA
MDRERVLKWLRFLVSGGTGFGIYYVVALGTRLLTGWPEGACSVLATILSVPPAFLMQRHFTFRSGGDARVQAVQYGLLQVGVGVLVGVMAQTLGGFGLHPTLSFFLAGASGIVASFVLQSAVVFRH